MYLKYVRTRENLRSLEGKKPKSGIISDFRYEMAFKSRHKRFNLTEQETEVQ